METSTFKSKDPSRSRSRGSSRFTSPTSRSRTKDVFTNSVPSPRYRERGKTTISTTVSTITIDSDSRRKFRRPNRVSSTESIKANELDDSPIVRITQDSRKRNSSLHSRSESSDGESDNVTNIKVFKRPTVNRELYNRTKQTKKRNNVQEPLQKVNIESYQKQIASNVLELTTIAEGDKIDKNDLINIVDQEEATIVDSAVESNTIKPTYVDQVKPVALIDITTASSNNKVDYTSDRSNDAVATTTARIETYEFNPNLVIIVTEHAESTSEAPRRRKVILKRRPISSNNTVEAEEEKRPEIFRRRKVIKRKRPLQDISSPISTEVFLEEEALEDSSLLSESTTPIGDSEDDEKSTLVTDQTEVISLNKDAEELPVATGFTKEMQDSTLIITEATLSTDYNLDGFTKIILETPTAETTTISNEEATDFFSSAAISTINTYADEEYQSTSEINVEATTIESTLATATIDNTESSTFLEETLVPKDPENLSTQIITTLSTPEPDSTLVQMTTELSTESDSSSRPSFESRYARPKFIRKNHVLSSGTNATNRYPPVLSSTENSNLEVLSRRRNNLFIRRHPISSTTTNILRDDLKYQEEKQDINNRSRDLIRQEVAEDTILKNKSVSTDALSDNFAEFWKNYTTASSRSQISNASIRIEDIDDRKVAGIEDTTYQSISITTSKSEIRPRYKIPVILKRPFDPEEALSPKRYHSLDSAPEESEETPETKETRLRQSSFRQPRTRYKLQNRDTIKTDEEPTSLSPEPTSTWQYFRTRLYSKRPSSTSTEMTVTETLIPARKFDYVADAFYRKQQSLKTPKSNDPFDSQNLVDPDYTSVTTAKPSVTRLVTSVTESGTTERQKILIKTKYSSLTSNTKISADQFSSTTPSLVSVTELDDESLNEIRQSIERSTLPIEGEFSYYYDNRFTTESQEPSTIEIESVFSNLVTGKSSVK
ncbi:serine-rich adhesin for platelets-like [Polyergus mexicanus]|uniref:serine-rich adhesin for platelets-like n=1 Tax=Polyergus mexicanus TaxID=615972 RepID=UPI0038B6348E